jgi:hypothetical protein
MPDETSETARLRDQSAAVDIGSRNTASENMAPRATRS